MATYIGSYRRRNPHANTPNPRPTKRWAVADLVDISAAELASSQVRALTRKPTATVDYSAARAKPTPSMVQTEDPRGRLYLRRSCGHELDVTLMDAAGTLPEIGAPLGCWVSCPEPNGAGDATVSAYEWRRDSRARTVLTDKMPHGAEVYFRDAAQVSSSPVLAGHEPTGTGFPIPAGPDF